MEKVLSGRVLWSYDYELSQTGLVHEIGAMFSFTPPVHYHAGQIMLTNNQLVINGDIAVKIPLTDIDQLYLGFDDTFKRSLVKNGGLFWQPLRLAYSDDTNVEIIYLIIDPRPFGAKNTVWFETLKQVLAN